MTILRQRAGKPSASESELIRAHACGNNSVCCPPNKSQFLSNLTTTTTIPIDERQILLSEIANHTNINLINQRCGIGQSDRIIGGGGYEASIGKYPWMALLKYMNLLEVAYEFKCGGSLISSFYVLTAAHCLKRNLVAVRLGEHRISTVQDCSDYICFDPVQDIPIQTVQKHEQYDNSKKLHDIALVRLQTQAVFGRSVKTICLPTSSSNQLDLNEPYLHDPMVMTGWGRTERVKSSDVLIAVELPLVPNDICAKTYGPLGIVIYESNLCAGGRHQRDACEGDSGGPLQTYGLIGEKFRMVQYGIVATGFNCDLLDENHPGIYTKVSYYLKWILDHMSNF